MRNAPTADDRERSGPRGPCLAALHMLREAEEDKETRKMIVLFLENLMNRYSISISSLLYNNASQRWMRLEVSSAVHSLAALRLGNASDGRTLVWLDCLRKGFTGLSIPGLTPNSGQRDLSFACIKLAWIVVNPHIRLVPALSLTSENEPAGDLMKENVCALPHMC